jgi:hypothetical protein
VEGNRQHLSPNRDELVWDRAGLSRRDEVIEKSVAAFGLIDPPDVEQEPIVNAVAPAECFGIDSRRLFDATAMMGPVSGNAGNLRFRKFRSADVLKIRLRGRANSLSNIVK